MASSTKIRMGQSNNVARIWLFKEGFTFVWFKPHGRFSDRVYLTADKVDFYTDIYGLWDGLAFRNGELYFIQVKSNGWGSPKEFEAFYRATKTKTKGLILNVVYPKASGEIVVKTRLYPDFIKQG